MSSIQKVIDSHLEFCFTDGHAVEAFTTFFVNLEDLHTLDWQAINSEQWAFCYTGENDFQRRKQAEFLVKDRFPLDAVLGIAVFDEAMQANVQTIFPHLKVLALPKWYF